MFYIIIYYEWIIEKLRRDEMIYKVLYQEQINEVPVRERTKSLFIEANSEKEVRELLSDRKYNLEYIHPIEGAHLEYEQQSEDFKVENAS